MAKKLTGIAVIALLLFGVFGLAACDNISLGDYKTAKTTEILVYADAKGRDSYCKDAWAAICNAVTQGTDIVDAAISKPAVDTAVKETKKAIDAVEKDKFVEIETDEMVKLHTWAFRSGVPNNAIVLNHADENAEFECVADNGQFYGYDQSSAKSLTAKSGDTIYWQSTSNIEQAFVSVIVKTKDNIIGYAVIKIIRPPFHTASVLKAVIFPKVDNKYQSVSEEQVKEVISKIIRENEPDFSLSVSVSSSTLQLGQNIEVVAVFKNQSGKKHEISHGEPMIVPIVIDSEHYQGNIALVSIRDIIEADDEVEMTWQIGSKLPKGQHWLYVSAAFDLLEIESGNVVSSKPVLVKSIKILLTVK